MRANADNLAVLFCGQGVDTDGERDLVAEERPDLLELATELTGEDPFARAAEATRFAQPAIYCAQVARFERLGRPAGALHAGHSLGELAALATAGALDELDGLRLAAERGRLMDEAAEREQGGMLAVGSDRDEAVAFAESTGLALANENSPKQFVLSGGFDRIQAAEASARERGLRVKRLAVAGAFHSPLMEPAVGTFRERLDEVDFETPEISVISGVTARPFGSNPREPLAAALVSPVRWVDVLHRLRADGARDFLDVGPGKVIAGLVRRTLDDANVLTADKVAAHA
jgi:malonyl CoA-acyl carrier protein transacylase